jgi:hypothetical protein
MKKTVGEVSRALCGDLGDLCLLGRRLTWHSKDVHHGCGVERLDLN